MTESWLKQHERLLLILAGILVAFILFWQFLGKHYEAVSAVEAKDQQALDAQSKINQQLLDNYTKLEQQMGQQNAALQAANAALAAQTAAALKAVAAQQAADAKLNNAQLAQKLGTQTGQQIQSTDTGAVLTHDQSVAVVQALDQIPALKKELTDTQQQNVNQTGEIANLTAENQSGSLLITGLRKQLTDEQTTCTAKINQIKATGIKSRLKWFGAGVVVGFIGKIFVHIP